MNPPSARRCDCGYDLETRPTVDAPRVTPRTLLFSFDGRIGLRTYWKFFLPYLALSLVMVLLDRQLETTDLEEGIGLFTGLFILLTLYPSLAVGVKRCHDRNRSGWFLLLGLVPVLNLWLFVELAFLDGTIGPNEYGLPELRLAR